MLTSHGDVTQLIEHAHTVRTEAQCDLVIANDLKLGLGRKFFVTPTGWWEGKTEDVAMAAAWIHEIKQGGFYRSKATLNVSLKEHLKEWALAERLWDRIEPYWERCDDLLHGCFAVRLPEGFITTRRGKRQGSGNDPLAHVRRVDHDDRSVWVDPGLIKATLNAPMLDRIFETNPHVNVIVHLHRALKKARTEPYIPPGTVAEAELGQHVPFLDGNSLDPIGVNIQGHGSVVGFRTTDLNEIMTFVKDGRNWQWE